MVVTVLGVPHPEGHNAFEFGGQRHRAHDDEEHVDYYVSPGFAFEIISSF